MISLLKKSLFLSMLLLSFFTIGYIEDDSGYVSLKISDQTGTTIDSDLIVHFIDVGQSRHHLGQ